jgi:ABC-type polysaccharide/polyol phosphate export permease
MLNPIARYVEWSRDVFWSLQWPNPVTILLVVLASVVFFAAGLAIFNRKSRDIAQEL